MIKANEFRLGNYVMDEDKEICQITSIIGDTNQERKIFPMFTKSVLLSNNTFQSFEYLIPITLTEEWLIELGFEKDDNGVDIFDQDYCEWYQKEFPVIGQLCTSSKGNYLFDTNTDTLRIYFVHQLQNLYFALTGKELQINRAS